MDYNIYIIYIYNELNLRLPSPTLINPGEVSFSENVK